MQDVRIFSLLEVAASITKTLTERYQSAFWVRAEMNKLNLYQHSGHCYPELVEKKDGKVVAQMKSNLWKDDYQRINSKFKSVIREPLKDGIKILFLARITFDACYGLSLRIVDIDPAFTLGDIEREKQETIERLVTEGLFDRNKLIRMPLLPKRIAIISVDSSKGYADFMNILTNNPWNYRFSIFLFPSLLQGEKAVDDMIRQLRRIRRVIQHFDLVAIVRGGGGDIGLSRYNNFQLAKEIASFPLPVITGIGHATNVTVTEMISHTNAITPSKLAEFIIQRFHNVSVPVQNAQDLIVEKSRRILHDEKLRFHNEVKMFRSVTTNILLQGKHQIRALSESLIRQSVFFSREENRNITELAVSMKKASAEYTARKLQNLNELEKHVMNMSPENVLKRGYSITLPNGKAVQDISAVEPGDVIQTRVFAGSISSVVQSKSNNDI